MTRPVDWRGLKQVPEVGAVLSRVGRSWKWFAFFGVASIVLGILALIWPGHTLVALAVLFGIQLIVGGVFRLVAAVTFDDASAGTRALFAIIGLLGLVIGLYALRHIVITVIALGLILGIYWIVDGVAELFSAIEYRDLPGRGWVMFTGVLGIVAGIILLVWPEISLLTLAIVAGIWLIMFGIGQLMIASQLRAVRRAVA
ncbi:MAG TPA: HdeD family acid-resistance protein [Jatrophihabitantaceae bacterium]|jgi:uncharacterized membrane protein HdeD (DUF308 family)